MTPTPTFILLVALVWTLPATAAVVTYRRHGHSLDNVRASLKSTLDRAVGTPTVQPQPDA